MNRNKYRKWQTCKLKKTFDILEFASLNQVIKFPDAKKQVPKTVTLMFAINNACTKISKSCVGVIIFVNFRKHMRFFIELVSLRIFLSQKLQKFHTF